MNRGLEKLQHYESEQYQDIKPRYILEAMLKREKAINAYKSINRQLKDSGKEPVAVPESFTCDDCAIVSECAFAYHLDNINDYCVKEKVFT